MSSPTTPSSSTRSKRGALIIFEGLDRSGKSTQVARLAERLKREGRKVKQIGFPDRTSPTGLLINSYLTQKDTKLSDEAIHLLFSANRWEKAEEIRRGLESGTTIICDRYAFSGIAFSVIKGLSWEWCKSPDIGLPSPDLVLFLSLSPSTSLLRSGFGEERYETKEIQDKVRKVFERMGGEWKDEEGKGVWREVSAEGTIEEVEERIREGVEGLFEKSGRLEGEVGKLWVE
ncbi:bifunctional thymidylate/uridylate kinase [Sporobolomyces salmoneus]|uniref:bifunctional thymidylate/uridylate kinase n=1 Tax=Sporobolomyces salmoneus TaxID=183962 RepID=UPI00316C83B4